MSLFNEIQGAVINNPAATSSYHKELKEKNEKKEVKSEKQLRKEMRGKLSKDEYRKRYRKHHYELNKDKAKKWLETRNEKVSKMFTEIIDELWPGTPEKINYDEYFVEKFKEDNTDYQGKYRFSWRSSKIIFENWKTMKRYKKPIRIYGRKGINVIMNSLLREEGQAYQLLRPHLSELMDFKFTIKKHQTITKYPLRNIRGRLAKLIQHSDIAPSHVCNVLSAIQRGKYIASEAYLGRNSFIIGDVVVTQTGNVFQPCLENNISWLTPETVEDIHNVRMEWRKRKGKKKPPIYMVSDAYLVKIPINEREVLYYIIPT